MMPYESMICRGRGAEYTASRGHAARERLKSGDGCDDHWAPSRLSVMTVPLSETGGRDQSSCTLSSESSGVPAGVHVLGCDGQARPSQRASGEDGSPTLARSSNSITGARGRAARGIRGECARHLPDDDLRSPARDLDALRTGAHVLAASHLPRAVQLWTVF